MQYYLYQILDDITYNEINFVVVLFTADDVTTCAGQRNVDPLDNTMTTLSSLTHTHKHIHQIITDKGKK